MLIPNSDPKGGDTDGMGDLDNTPMPPMGPDNMDGGMEDPSMGGDPMADGGMGGDPSMGDSGDPMSDGGMEDPSMGGEPSMGGGDDEFMSKFNSLPKDKQVAAEKYVDSMVDDDSMPMEHMKTIGNLIDEAINDILSDKKGTKRPSKKLPKEYRMMQNPFKSPF